MSTQGLISIIKHVQELQPRSCAPIEDQGFPFASVVSSWYALSKPQWLGQLGDGPVQHGGDISQ